MSIVVPVPHLRDYKGSGFQHYQKTDCNQSNETIYTADDRYDFFLHDMFVTLRNDTAVKVSISITMRDPAPVYKIGIVWHLPNASIQNIHIPFSNPLVVKSGWEIITNGVTTGLFCYFTLIGIKDRLSVG